MNIGRKEALFALIAGLVPFVGRRANAQQLIQPEKPSGGVPTAEEFAALQRKVDSLTAQVASMGAFTKDASGNLTITGPNITINATSNVSIKASGTGTVQSGGALTVKGSTINLN